MWLHLYAICSLYPIVWMVFYSLKNNDEIFITNPFGFPTHFRVKNYRAALTAYNVPVYFRNSVIVTVISVFSSTVFALFFAYAVSRLRFGLKKYLKTYLMLGMFVPVQVLMIPLVILVRDLGIANTRMAVIIPYIAFNLSFATMGAAMVIASLPTVLIYIFFSEQVEKAMTVGAAVK